MILGIIYGIILGVVGIGLVGGGHGIYWPLIASGPLTLPICLSFTHSISRDLAFFRTKTTILVAITGLANWFVIDSYLGTPERFRAVGVDAWTCLWFAWQVVFVLLIARCVYRPRRPATNSAVKDD